MNPMRHAARRRWLRWFVAGVSASLSAGSVYGYDASTHSILSTRAAQRSILYTDTSLLADWGFGSPYTETFNSLDFTARQIDALVAAGSEHEDNLSQIKRVYNHFFDPQFNSYAGRGLYALSGAVTGHRSSDWALEETQELVSIP